MKSRGKATLTRSCRSRDVERKKKMEGQWWGLKKMPYQWGLDKTVKKQRKPVTTESSACSSQPLSDAIICYLKASAVGHWQKALLLTSTVGLFLLLLSGSHLTAVLGMKVWPPLKSFSECSPELKGGKVLRKMVKAQQSVHYGWLAIFFLFLSLLQVSFSILQLIRTSQWYSLLGLE